jgi:hypothetical protein
MRITKRQLKRIIKEEKAKLIAETKVRKLVRLKLRENTQEEWFDDDEPPAGAHSEYNMSGMATNKNAAYVEVHDDAGGVIDKYTISLHPDYGTPEYESSPQPVDMSEFVQWAQSHNLFSLPSYDHSLPGTVPFEDIIMILDEQDEYGKAYNFPPGTPGAS